MTFLWISVFGIQYLFMGEGDIAEVLTPLRWRMTVQLRSARAKLNVEGGSALMEDKDIYSPSGVHGSLSNPTRMYCAK